MADERISWTEYFINIAYMVAERSTCIRRKVGAVAVKDKHILATGYNGVPSGVEHCLNAGCLRAKMNIPSGERHEICRGLHAEQNVIIQCAVHGAPLNLLKKAGIKPHPIRVSGLYWFIRIPS